MHNVKTQLRRQGQSVGLSGLLVLGSYAMITLLLTQSCGPAVQPNRSALLDRGSALFLGEAKYNEYPGDAALWRNQEYVITGTRRQLELASRPTEGLIWLVRVDSGIVWEKSLGEYRGLDVVPVDDDHAFVLVTSLNAAAKGLFTLKKMDHSGTFVEGYELTSIPKNASTARLAQIDTDHFLILAWTISSDSAAIDVRELHIDAQGNPLDITWNLGATKLFTPTRGGDIFGIRDRLASKSSYTAAVMRIQRSGKLDWLIENPFDTVKAQVNGVAQTASGDVMISAFADQEFRPIIAKVASNGEHLWTKTPEELNGYRTNDIANIGKGHYLISAQKNLTRGFLQATNWDAFAGFVIDEEGRVLDEDILSEHWAMSMKFVSTMSDSAVTLIGLGGKDTRSFLKQTDIAFFMFRLS